MRTIRCSVWQDLSDGNSAITSWDQPLSLRSRLALALHYVDEDWLRMQFEHQRRREIEAARLHRLAAYNAERGRGIAHDPAYDEWMAREQAAFDRGEF